MQKVGAGFTAQNKMHWDTNNVEDGGDGYVKVAWENDDLFVLVTVYAAKVLAYFSPEQVSTFSWLIGLHLFICSSVHVHRLELSKQWITMLGCKELLN